MQKRQRDKKKLSGLTLVCLLLSATAVLSLTAVTAARYVQQWKPAPAQADAKDFYFTSDLLTDGDTPVYQLSNFVPGTSTISFQLRNYADALRVSESNVAYTVAATGLPNTTGTIAQSGSAGQSNEVALAVPATSFANGKATVRVTAQSTAPYAQTLEAVFELYQKISIGAVTHEVYDAAGSNTVTLTVTTRDEAGTISITPPGGVYPDRTDSRLASGNSFNANANAQYSFVFFKSNPATTYAASSFGVSGSVVS